MLGLENIDRFLQFAVKGTSDGVELAKYFTSAWFCTAKLKL